MTGLLLKGVIAGVIVVGASELARRSTVAGAILVSLPLISILALTYLWLETRDLEQITALSWSIMWVVLPSIAFFAALPLLVQVGLGFWPAMAGSIAVMVAAYAAYAWVMTRLGVQL